MTTLQSKYFESTILAHASGQKLPSRNFSPTRGSLTNRSSERSRSITSRAHRLRSKQFQISNPEKIIQGLRPSIVEHPDILKQNKEICSLQEQINETVGDLDRHMLKVLHQQETNFLIAYKGVMRQIAQDLNKYKEELKKYTEESKESENQYLRNTLALFETEIMDLFSVTRKFEEQNRELKKKILDLALDLKSEKQLNVKLGITNKNLSRENRQIIMSTIGNNDKMAREQAGEQSRANKAGETKEDDDSHVESPVMLNNGSPVLITENEYDRKNPEKNPRGVKFEKNQGIKEKMQSWIPFESSYQSRSISPLGQTDVEDNNLLRLSLKALLKPNLKADVDLDDIVELVIGNIERCSKSRKRTADTASALSSRKYLETATPRVQEFEYLKSVLSECLEEAVRKASCTPVASHRKRPKSAMSKHIVELFMKEKEINKVIASHLETARSDKRTIESTEQLNMAKTIETEKDEEDLTPPQRKTSEEELDEAVRQHFSFANNSLSEGRPKIKKLNLEILGPKETRKDQEKSLQRTKSALSNRKESARSRGGSSHRENPLSEREKKKVRESLTLTSLLNIKKEKELRLSTEPDYVSTDPNPEFTNGNGATRSKSPLTSRVVIYNGKLYVRNVSPAP